MGTTSKQGEKQTTCQRCGICCRNGPPALHSEDISLYTNSLIGKEHLLTLRRGERVYDNVQDRNVALSQEMIRLRSVPGDRACFFYDPKLRGCRIYAQRPLECRALKCWDPEALVRIYARDRVQRLDLISDASALGQIICQHEAECCLDKVSEMVTRLVEAPDTDNRQALARILDMDMHIRQGLQDRVQVTDRELEFLFGRPLVQVLPGLGLKVGKTPRGYHFQPLQSAG